LCQPSVFTRQNDHFWVDFHRFFGLILIVGFLASSSRGTGVGRG
jgi:hypothetical protein